MAYDVAFRMKASRFKLTSWGHTDPSLPTQTLAIPPPYPPPYLRPPLPPLPSPPPPPFPLPSPPTPARYLTPHPYTPVNQPLLASLLAPHPARPWVAYLLQGHAQGFRIGYRGCQAPHSAHNLRSALACPQVIQDYLGAECRAGHMAGPFPTPPLPDFVVNPLGAVPKRRSGKWRLIMHLSHPPPGSSVNDGIDVADFPLRYSTVYDAMDSVMHLGRGALMAKVDIKSAFRLCPVHPDDHHLLGMWWKGHYFFDRVLPFVLRSAPCIFNCLADAIEWVAKQNGVSPLHHYLDDFFMAGAPASDQCATSLQTLSALCQALGIPMAEDKREGPSPCLEYLGILLDSQALEARLPRDKLEDIHISLREWATSTHCSKQELLSLVGTLSFAAKVVPPGRTFIRRMIDLSTTASSLQDTIPVSPEFRLDLEWWQAFATPWSGRSFFLLPDWSPSRPPALHRQLRHSWLWGLLPGRVVQRSVVPSPAWEEHPVEGALSHCAGSLSVGQMVVHLANPPPL